MTSIGAYIVIAIASINCSSSAPRMCSYRFKFYMNCGSGGCSTGG